MDKLRNSKALRGFFKLFNALAETILLLSLGGLFLVVLVQIGGRILGMPAPWTEEGTRYLFLWMMFTALAYGFRFVESARVSVFIEKLPSPLKTVTTALYVVSTLGFFAFMIYYGAKLTNQQIKMHEIGAAITIPMWFIGVSLPFSGLLGIVSTIQGLLDYPQKLK